MGLKSILKAIGHFAQRAFGIAKERGLTDQVLNLAIGLVNQAKSDFTDNDKRREWAVSGLVAAGVRESVARLAIELAVQASKK